MTTVLQLRLQFEQQEELPAVNDLSQGFFDTKKCTGSCLKARDRFLHQLLLYQLKFELESMNSSCFSGNKSEARDLNKNNMMALTNKHFHC